MNQSVKFCQKCGSQLDPGLKFCEDCGQPVPPSVQTAPTHFSASGDSRPPLPPEFAGPVEAPAAAAEPPDFDRLQIPTVSYTPQPPKKKSNTCLILVIVLGVIIACVAAVVIGGFVIFNRVSDSVDSGELQNFVESIITEQPLAELATSVPALVVNTPLPFDGEAETIVPAEPLDTGAFEYSLFDDFSNSPYEWGSDSDEISEMGIVDETFVITIFEPEYIVWAYIPADFDPTGIQFDASISGKAENGTYGVMCRLQNDEDYYFAEVDPYYMEFTIGHYLNGETTYFVDEDWQTARYLEDFPNAVNTVQVVCDPDMISLFINSQVEAQVALPDGPAPDGSMALYGLTWDTLGDDEFKVIFDNVTAYRPAQ